MGKKAFTMDVTVAVLALKYDLTQSVSAKGLDDGYAVPFVPKLSQVNSAPSDTAPGPIYFTRDWNFPRDCFIEAKHVLKYLDDAKFTHVAAIESDAKSRTFPDDAGKPQSFENAELEYSYVTNCLSQIGPSATVSKARSSSLKQRKAQLEKLFTSLIQQIDAASGPLKQAADKLRECRANFQKLRDCIDRPDPDLANEWMNQELDNAFHQRNELSPQAKDEVVLNYYNGPRDQLITVLQRDMSKYLDKTIPAAKSLAERASAGGSDTARLSNAASDFRDALVAFQTGMTDLINTIKGYDFQAAAERYHKMLRRYSMVDRATAYCIKSMVTRRRVNGRRVLVLPTDHTQFLNVDGVEVGKPLGPHAPAPSPETMEKALATIIPEVEQQEKTRIPPKIIAYAYKNESGLQHAINRGRLKNLPQCGTDFDNGYDPFHVKRDVLKKDSTRRGSFDECVTSPSRGFVISRGWGFTQLTPPGVDPKVEYGYFLVSDDGSLEDHSQDTTRHIRTRRGLPVIEGNEDYIPAYIASTAGSLHAGIKLFALKFKSTTTKRGCTFTPEHDCDNCLSRFQESDVTFKPQARASLMSVEAYRRIRDGRQKGAGGIPEGAPQPPSPSGSSNEPEESPGEDERLDWPCAWPTARMYYAGISVEGFNYVRQSIRFARLNKGLSSPEPKKKGTK
ncbi:hypothetical protein LVJ94_35085 [Pendulispora rubella]|uniref:Uncharacterized protein n=1 Tax=Pendulispora rubella TaxID=2741070 RepID=A0ABZ2L0K6_9BACT